MIPGNLSNCLAPLTPALANHLWQSTLCLFAAGLLALLLRRNHARFRYGLWLAASVKFLIPFTLLISLGAHLPGPRVTKPAAAGIILTVEEAGQPFTGGPHAQERRLPPELRADWRYRLLPALPAAVAAVWLGGFLLVLAGWWQRWRGIANSLLAAEPLAAGREVQALRRVLNLAGVRKPIDVLLSRTSLEPGVFGIVHPVLVWPAGISAHLQEAHLEAILAHEVWHIRRRDNLAASVHMAVEAIFWFHPLVWWVGARMVEERERACDEQVLQLLGQPQIYAESILKTCQFCLESPLACVSGITGAELKKRIVRIMAQPGVQNLSLWRKLLLTAAGIAAIAGPVVCGLFVTTSGAQSPTAAGAPAPSFEVVSIKPNHSGIISTQYSPNRYTATNKNARFFIRIAYGSSVTRFAFPLREDQLVGGPGWTSSKYFDVDAKIEDSLAEQFRQHPEALGAPLRLMIRAMLADRFKLRVSHTTKELPAYALVPVEGGAKFLDQKIKPGESYPSFSAPNQPPRGSPCVPKQGWACLANFMSMADLAVLLSGLREMNRPVVDGTGLQDTYFLKLEYEHTHRQAAAFSAQDGGGNNLANDPPTPAREGPSLLEALRKQLGLKLESTMGRVDIIVIDHIEMPTEN